MRGFTDRSKFFKVDFRKVGYAEDVLQGGAKLFFISSSFYPLQSSGAAHPGRPAALFPAKRQEWEKRVKKRVFFAISDRFSLQSIRESIIMIGRIMNQPGRNATARRTMEEKGL